MRFRSCLLSVLLVTATVSVWASPLQDRPVDEVMSEAEAAFQQAEGADLERLSPHHFSEARKFLLRAQNAYRQGRQLKTIRDDLNRSLHHLSQAEEVGELARTTLSDLIQTRQDAADNELPIRHSKPFQKADKDFEAAMRALEKDKLKRARTMSRRAREGYCKAAVATIRDTVLKDAYRKLKEARRSLPRETYNSVKRQLDQTRNMLGQQQLFEISTLVADIEQSLAQSLEAAGIST